MKPLLSALLLVALLSSCNNEEEFQTYKDGYTDKELWALTEGDTIFMGSGNRNLDDELQMGIVLKNIPKDNVLFIETKQNDTIKQVYIPYNRLY
jgi:hypothetical protein